jgi:hypothetical protein
MAGNLQVDGYYTTAPPLRFVNARLSFVVFCMPVFNVQL